MPACMMATSSEPLHFTSSPNGYSHGYNESA
jgi:hypothetical protein